MSGDTTTFEVIVVNDASTDSTLKMLKRISGLRIVNIENNVGFLLACNKGLEAARGEYIVYLNNDTQVQPGWLDALIDNFQNPSVGLVGAKLVYPDGRLQEAGGIIFSDASGWNFGRLEDPSAPPFSYRREVDYVSGAAIAVRKSILDTAGGFDERFVPAYYEDTDLAFEVRRQGFTVVYEPNSVVVHHEGISHGTDESSGIKAYQAANKTKFFEKWKTALESHDPPGGEIVFRSAARWTRDRGTILVFDAFPTWNHDSGSRRLLEILTSFRRRGFNVVLVPSELRSISPYDKELSNLGILVWSEGLAEARAYVEKISDDIVLVFAARPNNMQRYIESFADALPGIPVVFDTVDLHFLRNLREMELRKSQLSVKDLFDAAMDQALELNLMKLSDLTLVVSPIELGVISTIDSNISTTLLSNVHRATAGSPGVDDREGILFVANFNHVPNSDGLDWFLREVHPHIVKNLGPVKISIVGTPRPEGIDNLQLPGVEVLGWVEDLAPLYAAARAVIAPMRFGAGVKGKVGEAWSHGVPVVMTAVAAEGMGVFHGANGLVADDPAKFAQCVIDICQDDKLWGNLSLESQRHVDSQLGLKVFEKSLDAMLKKIGIPSDSSRKKSGAR
jgi:GT2 family glycosyltransferase